MLFMGVKGRAMEIRKKLLENQSGFMRQARLQRSQKGTIYNLYQPALNLSPEKYNELLAEIKKRGNMG